MQKKRDCDLGVMPPTLRDYTTKKLPEQHTPSITQSYIPQSITGARTMDPRRWINLKGRFQNEVQGGGTTDIDYLQRAR